MSEHQPSSHPVDIHRALDTARRAAEAGGRAALAHFRTDVVVETKPDRSPVTIADRDSEAAILAVLRADFPDVAVLAEESGAHAGRPGARWIVDPLDGTRGFSRGGVFWGPLVALEQDGAIVAGAMSLPALGPSYWAARGLGAFRDGVRLSLSRVAEWRDATLSLGELRAGALLGAPWESGVIALTASAASARCVGDLAGCAMLLDGRAEAWLEAGVQLWDLAPLKILVEEAGGRFTDFDGTPSLAAGNAVASNGLLHAHLLAALAATPAAPR